MTDVSIVVPSFNRRESVCRIVEELFRQRAPGLRFEIIVVLDGSTDGSANALACLVPPADVPLRVLEQANRGRAGARNAGLRLATGEVVLFLDDDVVPEPDLVAAHRRAHAAADGVLGRIEHADESGVPRAISEQERLFHDGRHRALSTPSAAIRPTDVFAGNLSVKRRLLHQIGGFDDAFVGYGCEDWDLARRLLDAGARFVYVGDAVVRHRPPVTLAEWRRRAWQEGRSQLTLVGKHPGLASELDIAGLHNATWTGRLLAQIGVQSPRLGMLASGLAARLASVPGPLLTVSARRRIGLQSWRLAFWSGVSSTIGSAAATRDVCRFNARILCYHRVCEESSPALAEWAVRPRVFRRQLEHLRRHGYRAVTLDALVRAFEAGRSIDKVVVITFDDGYRDTVTTAAPILDEFGFPATVFVVGDLLGKTAEWDREHGGLMAPLADAGQLRSLRDRGWEIAYHTATHPDLTALPDPAVREELSTRRTVVERATGGRVTSFAYPYGQFTPAIARAVEEAGFQVAVGLGPRWATPHAPRFALDRATVKRRHGMLEFRLMLSTGLDAPGLVSYGLGAFPRLAGSRRPVEG